MTFTRDAENTFSLSPLSFYSSSKQGPCHGFHYVPKSVTVKGLLFLRGKTQPPACKTNAAWNTFKHEEQRGLFYIWTIQSITVSFAHTFSKSLTTIYCLKKKPYTSYLISFRHQGIQALASSSVTRVCFLLFTLQKDRLIILTHREIFFFFFTVYWSYAYVSWLPVGHISGALPGSFPNCFASLSIFWIIHFSCILHITNLIH